MLGLRGEERALLGNGDERALDDRRQDVQEPRVLDQIVERALLHDLDSHLFVALAGDDDEWHACTAALELGRERRPAAILQFQIENHQIRDVSIQRFARGFCGAGSRDLMALLLKRLSHQEEQTFVVIDDQDAARWCGGWHEFSYFVTSGASTSVTNNPNRRMASAKRS